MLLYNKLCVEFMMLSILIYIHDTDIIENSEGCQSTKNSCLKKIEKLHGSEQGFRSVGREENDV